MTVIHMFNILQVWDAVTGAKQHTFEGHEAPVYSVCPHHKENIQVIFISFILLVIFISFHFFLGPLPTSRYIL